MQHHTPTSVHVLSENQEQRSCIWRIPSCGSLASHWNLCEANLRHLHSLGKRTPGACVRFLFCFFFQCMNIFGWIDCFLTITGRVVRQILILWVDHNLLCTGENTHPGVGVVGEVVEDVCWRVSQHAAYLPRGLLHVQFNNKRTVDQDR